MSAEVRPLDRDEVFWFRAPATGRHHAFELVDGELETLAVCGKVVLDQAEDLPTNDPSERLGHCCTFCLSGVV